MSTWIDSMDQYIVSNGASLVMQKKFLSMIDEQEVIILK
jgi:hypothetical protein